MRMKLYRSFMLSIALTGWLATAALAQSRVVTGTVNDPNAAAVPGANIVVKGSSSATTADADGKYSLEANGNDIVLVFSFIGFATQEGQVGNQSLIDVTI